jgi:NAD+ diphosphatase
MLGFVAWAEHRDIDVDGAEIEAARWFSREEFAAAAGSGRIQVPRGVSISSSLLADWYGGPLPGGE